MNDASAPQTVVPRFEPLVGRSGIHIHDPVEDVQAMLFSDQSVDPTPASTEEFVQPVDSAVEITVSELRTPFLTDLLFRNPDGGSLGGFSPNDARQSVPSGDYLLEVAGMGMKIYVRIDDSSITASPNGNTVEISLDGATTVKLGARSIHFQPARTLTTTSDPADLMRAISLFGNAMKTWSAERTFPSLRGHPPLLELDTECRIPTELTPPDNDVALTIPPEHPWLFVAAPLAYWLGATVEPGSPALHVDGKRYPMGRAGGYAAESEREAFERHVRDVLQFTFTLDCAVRTEGFYDVELDVRRRVERAGLPLDFERLYDASLAERVQTYLDLEYSFDELEDRIGRPDWRLTADVDPAPERATTMPFLARDLAVVRCPSMAELERAGQRATAGMEDVFARSSSPTLQSGATTDGDVAFRSSSSPDTTTGSNDRERVIGLPEADSMSQAWVGDGFAVGAAKASTSSYLQRLESHAEDSAHVSVDVVVNDEEMAEEESVSEIYGTRDHLSFDVDVHRELTSDELADVFESDTDFVHYVGHVDPEGFDCTDGYLNANQLGTVGADTFVLNACASYEQGQRLVDRGAIAGVVTLEDVINSMATKIGVTVARLLNYGFPIGSATGLIQETIFTGSNYVVVGDSTAALAQSNVAVPNVVRVSLRDDGRFDVSVETFASWNYDVGSMYRPYVGSCNGYYVVPGKLDTFRLDGDALDSFLDVSTFPVVGHGSLHWSDDVSASSLRELFDTDA